MKAREKNIKKTTHGSNFVSTQRGQLSCQRSLGQPSFMPENQTHFKRSLTPNWNYSNLGAHPIASIPPPPPPSPLSLTTKNEKRKKEFPRLPVNSDLFFLALALSQPSPILAPASLAIQLVTDICHVIFSMRVIDTRLLRRANAERERELKE